MSTYEKATNEVRKRVLAVMGKYHGHLVDAEVMIDVVMARPKTDENGDSMGAAIRVQGYVALACIRVLGLRDRVTRDYDAEMMLDANHWEISSDEDRNAIVDHELTHLELMVGDGGVVKRDDASRPRLRMRRHDRHLGWFDQVARRHGEHSIEVIQAREMLESDDFKQCYLFELETADA